MYFRLQRRIWDCCNIQDGALCDNSERLVTVQPLTIITPTVNYYHEELHLVCCSSPRSASGLCNVKKVTTGIKENTLQN